MKAYGLALACIHCKLEITHSSVIAKDAAQTAHHHQHMRVLFYKSFVVLSSDRAALSKKSSMKFQ